jgi:tetratricopeptide (TPR) repeat protein
MYLGLVQIVSRRAAQGIAEREHALALDRNLVEANWMTYAGIAKNYLGLYDQAIPWFRQAIKANPNFPHPHFVLGAALALLGRLDEARSAVRSGLTLNPTFTVSRARGVWSAISDDPIHLAQLERLLDAIRKAGAPEG